jgi:chitin disaccharide deacetylase
MGIADSARRRLVVNADDFGRSSEINQAVVRAHREGILTTASLMVGGAAATEAVQLARANPGLGVGLHLTLVGGRASASSSELPGLADAEGRFDENPVRAGWRYFADRRLRDPLRREIRAQFEAFRRTGLRRDHVNGHLHFHLHPTVLRLWLAEAGEVGGVRLTRDPLWLNLHLGRRRWIYRWSHALIFGLLSAWAVGRLRRGGWRYTDAVFGLLQNGAVDEQYVLGLLANLPAGDSELYSHPSQVEFGPEWEALVSERVRAAVRERGVCLTRYQDL